MRLGPLMTLSVFAACSSSHDYAAEEMSATDEAGAMVDTGAWGAPVDENDVSASATHWDLGGSLMVIDGEILVDQSELAVGLIGASQERLCDGVLSIETAEWIDQSPEDDVYMWWRIQVADPVENGCLENASPVPNPLYLGIGAMHPEIRAVMGSDDTLADASVSTLNAIYASFGADETLWVFGAAGTPEAFDGEVEAADASGSMDGYWQFEPLYSFPL